MSWLFNYLTGDWESWVLIISTGLKALCESALYSWLKEVNGNSAQAVGGKMYYLSGIPSEK